MDGKIEWIDMSNNTISPRIDKFIKCLRNSDTDIRFDSYSILEPEPDLQVLRYSGNEHVHF